MRRIDVNDLRHTCDFGDGAGGAARTSTCDQDVDVVTKLARGGDGMQRRGTQRGVVVFGKDEDSHELIAIARRSR
jgi:hypothetical protein